MDLHRPVIDVRCSSIGLLHDSACSTLRAAVQSRVDSSTSGLQCMYVGTRHVGGSLSMTRCGCHHGAAPLARSMLEKLSLHAMPEMTALPWLAVCTLNQQHQLDCGRAGAPYPED